ncbi:DUF1566 domain-containing protein [Pseudoxanthomonas indica]|uniref:Lcl C-terminal domain-containing protein n=1 Tax=Pseudoxanthomonas indica TaxID=428993 RepID=A0A1T5K148_9GAMM|nr:DUF1566 domain-containing protein [Pseudoxanthomonas indica]GGD45936.1 hypothetical protein GCM10007235_17410 [Pseudoxanthomonas indica]SKC57512.1 Protein of unknown function [Pseudoxanthomonas indica]
MKQITLVKLDAQGNELPAEAADWVAVRVLEHGLIFTATHINAEQASQEALQEQVKELDLLGAKDWDLPTIEELQLLVDRSRYDPAINTDFFRNIESDWYWSKTPAAWSSASAWCVSFSYGGVDDFHRYGGGFALAVRRAGQ